MVEDAINALFAGTLISKEKQLQIFEMLHERYICVSLASLLNQITSPRKMASIDHLRCLGEIIKYLITIQVHDKQNEADIINSVLNTSQLIFAFCEERPKKRLLTSIIKDHGVWQDNQKWIFWIYKVIERRRSASVGRDERAKQEKEKEAGWGSSFKGFFSSAKEEEKGDQMCGNIVFNTLTEYICHFTNFGMNLSQGRKLLQYFCEKYVLDEERTHVLISEFEASQRIGGHILTDKEKSVVRIQKRGNRMMKWGFNDTILVLGLTVKFLGSDSDLVTLLKMSRTVNECLKDSVYKQSLLYSLNPVTTEKRQFIWRHLLDIDNTVVAYGALRDKINENTEFIESVEEVIKLDAQRSFTNISTIDQEVLKNILKTYAFYNSEVTYCQGMNFLAGFLFLFFKDEETTFKALTGLINRFNMSELFKQDLPLLKEYFYKLDRLISMKIPDLHAHFKNENIQASLYSSSWFITLMGNSLQFQTNDEMSPEILKLWDNFLIYGYKGVF